MTSQTKTRLYRMNEKPNYNDKPIPPAVTMKDGDAKIKKVHIELFLRTKDVPLWERGGKIAFAKSNGKEFATDAEFEELFKKY